jgi:resolvase-like protein
MTDRQKITDGHRRRRAVVYVRQSTPTQVEQNPESRARQYAPRERAVELGWAASSVSVVDEDLGRSGASTRGRLGFKELVAEVGLGHVGLVLALEVSRLARSSADWHQLLDLCALTGTLIAHRLVLRNVVDDLVKAQRQKSPNMISAIGRYPDMASPAETSPRNRGLVDRRGQDTRREVGAEPPVDLEGAAVGVDYVSPSRTTPGSDSSARRSASPKARA